MIVVGIPAYDEEGSVGKVVRAARNFCDLVVVCDDGSSDRTAEEAKAEGALVVSHARNLGYGAAISTLFMEAKKAGADVLVTLDADGQHDPSQVPWLITPIASGVADVVIGSRFLGKDQTSTIRRAGIGLITTMSGAGVSDSQSGFRAYGRMAIGLVSPSEMGMGASVEILARARDDGLRIAEVPITVAYPVGSHTHNAAYHGLDVVTGIIKQVSIRHPLLAYCVPGLLFLLVSAGFFGWTLDIYGSQHRIVTTLALATVSSGLLGAMMSLVGILLWVLVSAVRETRA